ncbi:hypothetical protein KSP40_PGU022400 [Platanthera guangdongensis]|uniref:DNA replication complex GINS protein SLD5 n=1 Tax=Platanthera guangdongensis TaxID=2320717 RepID=A0ABR2MVC1_9ASPA
MERGEAAKRRGGGGGGHGGKKRCRSSEEGVEEREGGAGDPALRGWPSSEGREQIQLLEETLDEFTENRSDDLVVSLYQMDLDRALFLLRSYLRIRLQKIENYMVHISKTNLWNRLSEQEQRFAKRCIEIMEKHLEQSVLSRLPYGYQSMLKQSISSEEDDMVPEPQLDTFVFCKTKSDVGAFQLDDTGEEIVDLVADDLYVLRYKSIRGLVDGGRIDLV